MFPKPLQLQPVTAESDELLKAIAQDPLGDGDTWDLHQEVDSQRLNMFLDEALKDAKAQAGSAQSL